MKRRYSLELLDKPFIGTRYQEMWRSKSTLLENKNREGRNWSLFGSKIRKLKECDCGVSESEKLKMKGSTYLRFFFVKLDGQNGDFPMNCKPSSFLSLFFSSSPLLSFFPSTTKKLCPKGHRRNWLLIFFPLLDTMSAFPDVTQLVYGPITCHAFNKDRTRKNESFVLNQFPLSFLSRYLNQGPDSP